MIIKARDNLLEDIRSFYGDKNLDITWALSQWHKSMRGINESKARKIYDSFMENNEYYIERLAQWHLREPAFDNPVFHYEAGKERFCDFGAGIGTRGIAHVLNGFNADFIEINKQMQRFIKYRLKKHNLNGNVYASIPKKAKYDYILCCDVVGHISNPRETMTKVCLSLAPGGTILINHDHLCPEHDGHMNADFDFYGLYEELGLERICFDRWVMPNDR